VSDSFSKVTDLSVWCTRQLLSIFQARIFHSWTFEHFRVAVGSDSRTARKTAHFELSTCTLLLKLKLVVG